MTLQVQEMKHRMLKHSVLKSHMVLPQYLVSNTHPVECICGTIHRHNKYTQKRRSSSWISIGTTESTYVIEHSSGYEENGCSNGVEVSEIKSLSGYIIITHFKSPTT